MPPKVRDLIADLEQAGFTDRGGRGSHRNFIHKDVARPVTISGKLGDDAKRYQLRAVRRAIKETKKMKDSTRYAKIVEWSREDNCFVGSAPGLIYGGCHGSDERAVFDELCQIVDEAIELYHSENRELPQATAGRDLANKMQEIA